MERGIHDTIHYLEEFVERITHDEWNGFPSPKPLSNIIKRDRIVIILHLTWFIGYKRKPHANRFNFGLKTIEI